MSKVRRNNSWFVFFLVLMVVAGWVILQFAIAGTQSCTGRRMWSWSKVPPGLVCDTTPRF